MSHVALKTFNLSRDGVSSERIAAGSPVEIPPALVSGLVGAGYIAIDDGEPAPEIPADWRSLHHIKMIALAKQFDQSVSTKADAVALLETLSEGDQD